MFFHGIYIYIYEIIKTKIIRKNLKRFKAKDKEHVTKFFYENNKNFSI